MEAHKLVSEQIEYDVLTKELTKLAKHKLANMLAHGYTLEGAVLLKLVPIGVDKSFYVTVDINGMMRRVHDEIR